MSKPKLTYFPVGGRGEGIRALLAHSGFEYEDHRVTATEFAPVKEQTPLGGVPVWTEDGFVMCQSSSILRMLGIRLGYYTDDPITAWAIDSLVDFAESNQPKFGGYVYPFARFGNPLDEADGDAWIERSWGVVCPVYEKRLAEHGRKFIGGTDTPTIADFKCFQHNIGFTELNASTPISRAVLDKINAKFAQYPAYSRWVENMKVECAEYIKNRKPTPM